MEDDWMIRATNLSKVYPSNGLEAVCSTTFGVRKGSVMGLIGPNGAGKSSTFAMLAMDLPRSGGEAYLLGHSVSKIDLKSEGNKLGMCPQYNTIWEQLTVEENLHMISRIKGLDKKQFENNKKVIIDTLDLNEYTTIRAGNLSGGNKRKLSAAMTLLI